MTTTAIHPSCLSGVGRDGLLERIKELEADLASARRRADESALARDEAREREATMRVTLTTAQAEATRCLNIARAVKAIGDDPIMQSLAPLGAAIRRARELHAEGCALRHLVSEVGELADAMAIGDVGIDKAGTDLSKRDDRIREEAIDVAVVAMRIGFGETRP